MNFFQRIKDGAGKVSDRAQNAVEIGRLNTQITTIEREMGLYHQKMGEVFYDGYRQKDMSEAEKEMLELAKTCDLLVEERDEIRAKIAELKNERLCGACGRTVAEDGLYCQYCGHKLHRPKAASPVRENPKQAEEKIPARDKEPALEPEHLPVLPADPLDFLIPSASREEATASVEAEPEPQTDYLEAEEHEALKQQELERELRRQEELERERRRQEEMDQRIRSWQEVANAREKSSDPLATAIPVVQCQVCSVELVKGTKWCPHCGSEQI